MKYVSISFYFTTKDDLFVKYYFMIVYQRGTRNGKTSFEYFMTLEVKIICIS